VTSRLAEIQDRWAAASVGSTEPDADDYHRDVGWLLCEVYRLRDLHREAKDAVHGQSPD
jgi:hypothetical protein